MRKNFLWRIVGCSYRQLKDREENQKIIENSKNKTSEKYELLNTILDGFDEKYALDEYLDKHDRDDLNREYQKIFKEAPKVSYSYKGDSRISATLHWGNGIKVDTPCGIRLTAYGIDIDSEKIVKDFLYEWLVENRISLANGYVARRS